MDVQQWMLTCGMYIVECFLRSFALFVNVPFIALIEQDICIVFHVCVCMYECMYVCMYVCMYAYMYVCLNES